MDGRIYFIGNIILIFFKSLKNGVEAFRYYKDIKYATKIRKIYQCNFIRFYKHNDYFSSLI